jgi:hypothetical protein
LLILLGWSIVGLHHKQKEIRRFSSYLESAKFSSPFSLDFA